MKKRWGFLVIGLLGIGLAGCGNQDKLVNNMSKNANMNTATIRVTKAEFNGENMLKNMKALKAEGIVDHKGKAVEAKFSYPITGSQTLDMDVIMNSSGVYLNTKYMADIMKEQLKGTDLKMKDVKKAENSFVALSELNEDLSMKEYKKAMKEIDKPYDKKEIKQLFDGKKISKTKNGSLKVTLDKTDISNYIKQSDQLSSADRKDAIKSIKDVKKLNVIVINKDNKTNYEIVVKDKESNVDVKFDVTSKDKNVNVKKLNKSNTITFDELQDAIEPKMN